MPNTDSDAFGRCVRCGHPTTTGGCARCEAGEAPPHGPGEMQIAIRDAAEVRSGARHQALDEAIAEVERERREHIDQAADWALFCAARRLRHLRDAERSE